MSCPEYIIKSLVIDGEASESDEEPSSQLRNTPITITFLSEEMNSSVPKTISEELVYQIQQDITSSIVQIISETQQGAAKELSQTAEVLLSTQSAIQKVDTCLKLASTTSKEITVKLNDILTYNFIPPIYFGTQIRLAEGCK